MYYENTKLLQEANEIIQKSAARHSLIAIKADLEYFEKLESLVRRLLDELCDAQVEIGDLTDEIDNTNLTQFDTSEIIYELRSRNETCFFPISEFVKDLKETIKSGDKQHLDVLLSKLDGNSEMVIY